MMDLWWLANGELVDSRAIGASPIVFVVVTGGQRNAWATASGTRV